MNRFSYHLLIISLCFYKVLSQFNCFDCVGGIETNCGSILSRDLTIACSAQCYEAYIGYQNGSLPLIQRRCWTRPVNTTARTFCEWFPTSKSAIDSNADLRYCRTCTTDRCNGNKNIVTPVRRPINCSRKK